MSTEADILNDALAHLGEEATNSLDPANASAAVRKVLRFMQRARDAVLERHGWTDALEYVTLPRADEPGDWKYLYRFGLPGDALRVWTVFISGTDIEPKWLQGTRVKLANGAPSEGRVIRCDSEGPLDVAYVRRIGWSVIPTYLVNPIALQLAALACQPINGSVERAKELQALADVAIASAKGIDGTLQGGEDPLLPSHLAAIRAAAG